MESIENKRIYSNQFSVSIGPADCSIVFRWKSPDFDENDKIVGEKTLDCVTVSLSRENFNQLTDLLNELQEKVKNEDGKHE